MQEDGKIKASYRQVDDDILRTLAPPTWRWYALFSIAASALAIGVFCWSRLIVKGLGLAGINHPIGWGVFITNFVFWVGIAHSGTLISAILFLFRAQWRGADLPDC